MSNIMWCGYLHRNNTLQLKRWFGDHKDYTDDCDGNPNVLLVAQPFEAPDRDLAMKYLTDKLTTKTNCTLDNGKCKIVTYVREDKK